MQEKTKQLVIATVGFFWAFLLWFSTAAFSTSISSEFTLTTGGLALLASSALWLAPPGRVIAGWAADRFGAHNVFAVILGYSGLMSIASAFAVSYDVLFVERLIVASAGISFVVGIQHVSQWFDEHEIGTAEGIYAGTGNAGAGVGALVLPRLYGTHFSEAFLHLGLVALVIAVVYKWRGEPARNRATAETARENSNLKSTLYVWTRYAAIALLLAYAMSFGLEIAMNSWLPTYYATGFQDAIASLGFSSVAAIQTAAGTFAAVQSFNASLWRPFSGYMSDLWQRKGWTPYPFLSTGQGYAPRIHWLFTALCLIIVMMCALTAAGLLGVLPLSVVILAGFGICVSFGTGGVFAIVPVMFRERPGVAAGFIGGVSTAGGIVYPLVYGWVPNIHTGYVLVAAVLFVPFALFFTWVMRSDRGLSEHGIGSRERWLGSDRDAAAVPGGDD
ncbi:nitrate/nitrite transporter [Halarchaeum acidiphilum MH1-52-1]|uniref:Nitrate/nitrite transporter n=1 Tax=Halarchaeum acidiphilum MH1-52-1 TaxID=1261545 RepID=U2YW39_9EURY|nr:MFS transporter [Halarchaeum acidiphilum]GAD53245.1 nitrate/nitrite transporter [Halarchaeum acidiphilum MH1-52-1]